jgi:RNA polymerase sigma-70 factor (ECF subfamily)
MPRTHLVPDKPRPWLISTARFKAVDRMRRRARFDSEAQTDFALYSSTKREARVDEAALYDEKGDDEEIEDDRLRLIFTCCHPALPSEGQVALTLREICGLTTEEIARAFLVTPATLAQRIVRAKAVIRDKAIPYQVPASQELPARLGAVLLGVYRGTELSREAIRLGRLLLDLLMLLHESRRAARTSGEGGLILLEQQDPSLWNREQIAEGISLTESALRSRRFGAYTLQASIAAVHAESSSVASTDWRQITLLYDQLLRIQPSPVVELNRAVAVAMCEGLEQGLCLIDDLLAREQLSGYHLAHSARADLCRRLGRIPEARASYELTGPSVAGTGSPFSRETACRIEINIRLCYQFFLCVTTMMEIEETFGLSPFSPHGHLALTSVLRRSGNLERYCAMSFLPRSGITSKDRPIRRRRWNGGTQ